MTVIAWDGKTLAADKAANYAGTKVKVTKIYKIDENRLAGITGDGAHGIALVEWLKGEALISGYPKPASENTTAFLLVVYRNGSVRSYEDGGYYSPLEGEFIAMGSGRDYALGAMEMGASAEQAVEVAIKHSTNCGLGIDTLSFTQPE